MIDQPGFYKLSSEEYHADPAIKPSLSRGIVKALITSCPARARQCHPRLCPDCQDEHKTTYDIGQACHSLLLEGIDKAVVIEADSWRTNAAKAARDAAYDDYKVPLLREQYDTVLEVVESAEKQLADSELGIKDLRSEGESELSYFWQEGKDGIWCRVRPDWIQKDRSIILDYKTTGMSANPSDFAKNILSTGIDIQAAMYPRGVKKVEKVEPKFVLMVQELVKPHLCSFIALAPQFAELGKSKMKEGFAIWKECIETDIWPAYPSRVCHVDMPSWASLQWEERKLQSQITNQGDPTANW